MRSLVLVALLGLVVGCTAASSTPTTGDDFQTPGNCSEILCTSNLETLDRMDVMVLDTHGKRAVYVTCWWNDGGATKWVNDLGDTCFKSVPFP